MTTLELSNALAHDAKLVLSFITQRKFWDPRDPLRSLITLRAPLPMLFTALLALIVKSSTLVKQENDQVTDSKNTFPTQKESLRLFLHIGSSESRKHQNKNLSSKSTLLIPTVSTSAFNSPNLFLFSRHHIPTTSVSSIFCM